MCVCIAIKLKSQLVDSEVRLMIMASLNYEGPLSKWTNVMKGWQYRWFVLDDNAGLLSYYTVSF